ncbi:MAG: hypothetical protein U5J83_09800 [Bryobacterales bacterium]|nr:hypothetical protein [Bryobacterales bacterium]
MVAQRDDAMNRMIALQVASGRFDEAIRAIEQIAPSRWLKGET